MIFRLNSYLGKWYEIARIKNDFEPEMKNVTAQYNPILDDVIQVINTGYIGNESKQLIGIAKTTEESGVLKVSFFPNVFAEYKILYVDNDYQYALVGGSYNNYLWILSRTPEMDKSKLEELINIAKERGYHTDRIVLTEHDRQ